jgi:hypothetical protein
MEFAPGRNIAGFRETPFTEPEAAPIFRQLCDAVHYLHCERNPPFIHRDIKPQNIMIMDPPDKDGTLVKLVDFRIAKRITGTRDPMTQGQGTAGYIAPEVDHPELDENGELIPYGVAADCYSLGCTLYYMLTKRHPPYHQHLNLDTLFDGPDLPMISDNARDLIRALMHPDPYHRMNITEARASIGALTDPTVHVAEVVRTPQVVPAVAAPTGAPAAAAVASGGVFEFSAVVNELHSAAANTASTTTTTAVAATAADITDLGMSEELRNLLVSTGLQQRYESVLTENEIFSIEGILALSVTDLKSGLDMTLVAAQNLFSGAQLILENRAREAAEKSLNLRTSLPKSDISCKDLLLDFQPAFQPLVLKS